MIPEQGGRTFEARPCGCPILPVFATVGWLRSDISRTTSTNGGVHVAQRLFAVRFCGPLVSRVTLAIAKTAQPRVAVLPVAIRLCDIVRRK